MMMYTVRIQNILLFINMCYLNRVRVHIVIACDLYLLKLFLIILQVDGKTSNSQINLE